MLKFLVLLVLIFILSGCSGKAKEELYAEGISQIGKGNAGGAIVLLKNALEKDPAYLSARYQLALAYVKANKHEQAEKEFLQVLEQNPAKSTVHLDLARLYNTTGKPGQARAEVEEYLKSNGRTAEALGLIGESYALQKNLEQAERYLLQSMQGDAKNTGVKLALAGIYMAWRKHPEARRQLEETLAMEPKNSKACYLMAALENTLGNSDRALELYQQIAGFDKADPVAPYKMGLVYLDKHDVEKARKLATYLVKTFPDKGEGSRLQGLVQYYTKNYTEAIALLQESLKKQPSMEGYYFLGLSLYSHGELENALSQFRRIIDYNPSFVQARVLTSLILLRQGRTDDAISEIKKVLQVDPGHAFAHNVLGRGYLAKGMDEEGVRELKAATGLGPTATGNMLKRGGEGDQWNIETLMMLGDLNAGNKDNKAAMAAFTQAARNKPDYAPALYAQGVLLDQSGQKKEAAAKYRAALEKSENYVQALNNLACLYADGYGGLSEAERLAMRAYKLQPSNPAVMETLGYVLLKNGQKPHALELLQKAAERLPNNGYAQYHLALALMETGNEAQAGLKLKKALQLGKFPEQDQAKNLLAQLRRSEKRN
ncbi:tetratricopeptide repeat protein [Geotalea toluenoxydans]